MQYKYEEYINSIGITCPPSDYIQKQRVSFRFVFDDPAHENNFIPVLMISPRRINSRRFRDPQNKCKGYALSLFDSLEHAINRYKLLEKDTPNIHKTIGKCISKGDLIKRDGVVSLIDKKGHFNLHEFLHTNLANKFSVVFHIW